jgi:hypothetical protein
MCSAPNCEGIDVKSFGSVFGTWLRATPTSGPLSGRAVVEMLHVFGNGSEALVVLVVLEEKLNRVAHDERAKRCTCLHWQVQRAGPLAVAMSLQRRDRRNSCGSGMRVDRYTDNLRLLRFCDLGFPFSLHVVMTLLLQLFLFIDISPLRYPFT